jgi:hypothetical protein
MEIRQYKTAVEIKGDSIKTTNLRVKISVEKEVNRTKESAIGLSKQSSTKCETVNSSQKNCKYSLHTLKYIPIRIDDITTYALIDTVGSVSAMSKYFFDRLIANVKLNLINNNNKLRSIFGSSMDISVIYDLNISFDNSSVVL